MRPWEQPGTDRLPGLRRVSFEKMRLSGTTGASRTLLRKVMMRHRAHLHNVIQRGVNKEGQLKIIGVAIHVVFL